MRKKKLKWKKINLRATERKEEGGKMIGLSLQ